MGFIAPIVGGIVSGIGSAATAIGGVMGLSGAAATVGGLGAMAAGVGSIVDKDIRRVALPALGGMALGGMLAPTTGAMSGSASMGAFGSVSKSALLGGAVGGYTGMKLNEAAKMRKMQEEFYNNQKSYMARQEAEVSRRNADLARRASAAQAAQASALSIESERMARLQQRMQRGRRRGWNDDEYYGNLNVLLG